MPEPISVPLLAMRRNAPDLCVRQLDRGDLAAVEQRLLNLASTDHHSRFLGEVCDAAIVNYAYGLDLSEVVLMGAFDSGGRLVGISEAHRTTAPDIVEVSVSVDSAYRRQGLGRFLVARLLDQVFASGTAVAEFLYDPANMALSRLVRGLGARCGGEPGLARISCSAQIVMRAAA